MRKGLGGKPHFDPQNLNYLIADRIAPDHRLAVAAARGPLVASAAIAGTSKYFWDAAWWGDQGDTPHCTAFAMMHLLADGPVTHPHQNPLEEPHQFFEEIRQIDVSEGRDYGGDGATALAMAKAAVRRGWGGEYLWGYTIADFIAAIKVSPVLLGIAWKTGMDTPDRKHGIIRAQGSIRGYHEIEANGADFDDGFARLKQSWGRGFGKNGHVYLPFEDLEKLIAEDGDMVLFRELKTAA